MSKKQQILLIHGGTTFADHDSYIKSLRNKTIKLEWIASRRDWKNELQDQLGRDYVVYTPQMPNKTNAQYSEWKIYFEKILDALDENLVLIGHSLGGIFLVKYFSENAVGKKIKKIFILGAPFNNEGMTKEPLFSFVRQGSLNELKNQCNKLYFYHSKDDFAVPFEHIEKYEKELPKAIFRKFKDRNHFLQEEIPELVQDIKD